MAFDTPAQITVIGAGPIGLETALYGRFLGYDVSVFEQDAICHHVRQQGHLQLFAPLSSNSSALGMAALNAQYENFQPPAPETFHTGHQWIESYLRPLSESDLLIDGIHEHCKVVSISRNRKQACPNEPEAPHATPFRLLIENRGVEVAHEADIVIDTSGVLSQPKWLGPGGSPAIGEREFRQLNAQLPNEQRFFECLIPDFAAGSSRFADKTIMVVGSGLSAATTVCGLADVAKKNSQTKVAWIVDRLSDKGPITEIENDQLVRRDDLAKAANEIAKTAEWLDVRVDQTILAISYDKASNKSTIEFENTVPPKNWKDKPKNAVENFDQVIANVGYRPDHEIFRDLQAAPNDITQRADGAKSLVTTVPNFYVLGAKNPGRAANFLFSDGLQQIKDLFKLIGDRESLDLYAGPYPLGNL